MEILEGHVTRLCKWDSKAMPRPTDEDMKRLSAMVQRGELYPALNHTKWAELRAEMLAAPGEQHPQFRGRSVFAPPGFCTAWDGEFYYHLHPVAEWEWIELQAASVQWLQEVLKRHGIPYSVEAGVIRVWGYTRPGPQPDWRERGGGPSPKSNAV
ncbi:hypothetical protein AVMA1855_05460 [Acidovorax sp. SUPP1855]|uniref:DUF6678 family protein n=1 Tax=Acidovorax sp. SUPP1855 TaxID=431774 RepID=UPI0023DE2169|nr:DUF6678 family protein [Acidovorax sp. SUPP1855]GKS83566.1 hypothetical protein AVMA1855_05460 [Acidovorax sp. SUPP1855]